MGKETSKKKISISKIVIYVILFLAIIISLGAITLSIYTYKTILPNEVKRYVETHKAELKGEKGEQGDMGQMGLTGASGASGSSSMNCYTWYDLAGNAHTSCN